MSTTVHDLFEDAIELPCLNTQDRYRQLVGLDAVKERLVKEARILLNPQLLDAWSARHHGTRIALVDTFVRRPPLFVFAGDVGTGKTALAESFGDRVAREEGIPITLYRLSLNARGAGAVGEMTRLLGAAFATVADAARKSVRAGRQPSAGMILLIDEADALAQSREYDQMHHEDRAGVNALIRGIDALASAHLPALVVMCTNRLGAIDPAIRRRAAEVFEFRRPNYEQRLCVLETHLRNVGIEPDQLERLAAVTGERPGCPYGFTYSDLVQRFLPVVVLDAFPRQPIRYERTLEIAQELQATPPFQDHGAP